MPHLHPVPTGARLRRTALALTAGLALAVAGCGDDDEPASSGTTAPATSTAPTGTDVAPPTGTSAAPQEGSAEQSGRAGVSLDRLLRAFSTFAMGAQQCVQGDRGAAQECARKAFEPVEEAGKGFEDEARRLREGASAECRRALDRTSAAKDKLVGVLEDLRDAAATGEPSRFRSAGQEITSVLQGETADLVAAQSACTR